jgi:hypothetical protein
MFRLALGAFPRHGAAAIPFLEGEIEHPRVFAGDERNHIGIWNLIGTLAEIPDTRAGELLVTLCNSEDEELSDCARSALASRPRPEGKAVYLDLLRRYEEYADEDPYIYHFARLARAALQFGGPKARHLVQEFRAHPNESVASQARVALLNSL